ncbi:HNH endonuclease [Paenibacillus agaridevorans]|uniref:HNH endonuclease n=1 Tax=Paenibacillus agaridevorans TaxID=171404 RepID=UPI001BE4BAB6|nr:HNH endonuclease [Paenibacillus agaridevorans]
MSLNKAGKIFGESAGEVLGGSIQNIGNLAKNETLRELGQRIKQSTAYTFESVGNLADGALIIGAGLVDRDEEKLASGKVTIRNQIEETISNTEHGVRQLIKDGIEVERGIASNDRTKVRRGVSNLLKLTVAGTIGVGLFEILDGSDAANSAAPESGPVDPIHALPLDSETVMPTDVLEPAAEDIHHLDTINDHLVGIEHPESGVPYESVVVTMPSGDIIEGVFPDFPYVYAGELPPDMYMESDAEQFAYMNHQLAASVQNEPELAGEFNEVHLAQILRGETPDGYVWHHTEVPGQMELVDEQLHMQSGHDGGRSLWGGGSDFRQG